MRFFPRTARPRFVAASAVCSLAIGVLAVPLAHADDLKHKQHHVQGRIHSASHDLDESSARLRRVTGALDAALAELRRAKDRLAVVRGQLVAAHIRDQEMQAKLEAAVQRLDAAQTDLATGQTAVADQHANVTDVVTSIYEQGDPELLAFSALLNSQTPADLTRQSEARTVIVGRQTRAYDDLSAAEVLLQVRERQVQTAKDEVAVERRAAAAHLVTMAALAQQTREAAAQVRVMVVSRRNAHRVAASVRQHDRAVLQRLHAQENRIRDRILAAARRAAARHPHAGYQGRTGGFLDRPVPGPITSPFGYRMHPIYHYWGLHDGDDFAAGCGQPLIAVAGGTVVSEYFSTVWGNRLYLNLGQVNGRNLTVIYNHLSAYRVYSGQRVGRDQVVGNVGTTGWSTGCHLHFTVMVNGIPVDPMNWF